MILLVFSLFFSINTNAQLQLGIWGDAGSTQIDVNGFTSLSGEAMYTYDAYFASIAYSALFSEWRETVSNGFKVDIGRDFNIKSLPIKASVFYLNKPISTQIYEWDLGLFLQKSTGNWNYGIGGHYREICIKPKYAADFSDTKITEGFNLLYLLRYNIPLKTNTWKLHATITDFDHFLLLQETNPMVFVGAHYLGFNTLNIFSEFWYRSAGLNNIQVQYYGYFFRLGAVWKFEL